MGRVVVSSDVGRVANLRRVVTPPGPARLPIARRLATRPTSELTHYPPLTRPPNAVDYWRLRRGAPMTRLIGLGMLAAGALLAADTEGTTSRQAKPVTFAKDVAPILQERCQECHHAGSMAPMSLVTYEETRPWAKAIRQRVILRQMPPWHIDASVGVQKFKNDMSLTAEQIDTIVRWVDSGAPLGDPKDMPAPKVWPAPN